MSLYCKQSVTTVKYMVAISSSTASKRLLGIVLSTDKFKLLSSWDIQVTDTIMLYAVQWQNKQGQTLINKYINNTCLLLYSLLAMCNTWCFFMQLSFYILGN